MVFLYVTIDINVNQNQTSIDNDKNRLDMIVYTILILKPKGQFFKYGLLLRMVGFFISFFCRVLHLLRDPSIHGGQVR